MARLYRRCVANTRRTIACILRANSSQVETHGTVCDTTAKESTSHTMSMCRMSSTTVTSIFSEQYGWSRNVLWTMWFRVMLTISVAGRTKISNSHSLSISMIKWCGTALMRTKGITTNHWRTRQCYKTSYSTCASQIQMSMARRSPQTDIGYRLGGVANSRSCHDHPGHILQ